MSASFVCCTCKAGHRYPPPLVTARPPQFPDGLPRALQQATSTRRRSVVVRSWECGIVQQRWKTLLASSGVPSAGGGRRDAQCAEPGKVGRPPTCCLTMVAFGIIGRGRRSSLVGHSPALLRHRLLYAQRVYTIVWCRRSASTAGYAAVRTTLRIHKSPPLSTHM